MRGSDLRRVQLKFYQKQEGLCFWCNKPMLMHFDIGWTPTHHRRCTLDHIKPKAHGGSHAHRNLVGSCRLCNNDKGDKTLEAWLKVVENRHGKLHLVSILAKLTKRGITPQSANPETAPTLSLNPLTVQLPKDDAPPP